MHECWVSSAVSDSLTPWTAAHQAPLSMGFLQARVLECVAMPSSRGCSQPRDRTQVSHTAGRFFTIWHEIIANPFKASVLSPLVQVGWVRRVGEKERNRQASSPGFIAYPGFCCLFWLSNHGFCPLPSLPNQKRVSKKEGLAGKIYLVLGCLSGSWHFLGRAGDKSWCLFS